MGESFGPDDGNATLLRKGATLGRFIFVPDSFLIRSRFVPELVEGACPELAEGSPLNRGRLSRSGGNYRKLPETTGKMKICPAARQWRSRRVAEIKTRLP